MDPITISVLINAGLSIAGALGWIKTRKKDKEIAQVLERCPTANQDLKEIAAEAGLKVAVKALNTWLS